MEYPYRDQMTRIKSELCDRAISASRWVHAGIWGYPHSKGSRMPPAAIPAIPVAASAQIPGLLPSLPRCMHPCIHASAHHATGACAALNLPLPGHGTLPSRPFAIDRNWLWLNP